MSAEAGDSKPTVLPKGFGPRIYVGGVPSLVSETMVRNYFSRWGQVEDVYFPKDRATGRRCTYCFVSFGAERAAKTAVAESDRNIGGHKIKSVTLAEDRVTHYGRRGTFLAPQAQTDLAAMFAQQLSLQPVFTPQSQYVAALPHQEAAGRYTLPTQPQHMNPGLMASIQGYPPSMSTYSAPILPQQASAMDAYAQLAQTHPYARLAPALPHLNPAAAGMAYGGEPELSDLRFAENITAYVTSGPPTSYPKHASQYTMDHLH